VNDYDKAVLRGSALIDYYTEMIGSEPTVQDLIVDILAWEKEGRERDGDAGFVTVRCLVAGCRALTWQ